MDQTQPYPADLTVAYPDRDLNRVTTFFRPFTLIPIAIILLLLMGGSAKPLMAGGFIVLPTLLMLLFQQKYPKWWFDWNRSLAGLCARVAAYAALLTDIYPSTEEEQGVQVTLVSPNASALNRWLPLVKWFLAIPHFIVLTLLDIALVVVVIISWFAILFTRRLPRDLFDFVVGVLRWHLRVSATRSF
jgi:hypothetical protein